MANKDRYLPSRGVPEPRFMPQSKGVVHTVPSCRDRGFPTQGAKSFGFRGHGVDRFGPFGRGVGDGIC
jgi:hypothetical protein